MTLSLMLGGCSSKSTENDNLQNNSSKNNEVQESIDSDKKEIDKANKVDESKKIDESKNLEEEKSIELKIYTVDVDDTEKIVELKTINIKEDSTLEQKLKELCIILQKEYFKEEEATIALQSIDSNGIATINLVNQDAWRPHFQGSTGGIISQSTIIETLLQRGYEGEWIKGINVLIDGKSEEVFDHAPFNDTFYR
jgi:hypothetical protein